LVGAVATGQVLIILTKAQKEAVVDVEDTSLESSGFRCTSSASERKEEWKGKQNRKTERNV
jgi:hypothetical protein